MSSSERSGRPGVLIKQIAQQIRTDWVDQAEPGSRLPAGVKLAEQYGVSRGTINSALSLLADSLEIYREVGGGTFVSKGLRGRWEKHVGKMIGISFRDTKDAFADPFSDQVVRGAFASLHLRGLNLLLATHNWRWPEDGEPEVAFNSPLVVGIMLLGQQPSIWIEEFKKIRKKALLSIDHDATEDGIHSVAFDNVTAGVFLARRLHKLGHRRVLTIFEDPKRRQYQRDQAWDERREGFLKTWASLGNQPPHEVYLAGRGPLDDVMPRIAGQLKLPADRRPTAIFSLVSVNLEEDHWCEVLGKAELRVPQDLSIVTILGNGENASGLSGFQFDGFDMGVAATQFMQQMIANPRIRRHKPRLIRVKGKYHAGRTHARAPKP